MDTVTLNNIQYQFAKNYTHQQSYRLSFHELTEAIFGFNLEEWYRQGYWGDQYIPYSLIHNQKVVSNVSVSSMELLIAGKKKLGLQIGTVMSDPAYRNRGLNKFLLEQVVNDWESKADFIYLFANDTVLDFYPKFNFEQIDEFQHSKTVYFNGKNSSVKKLNIDNPNEKNILIDSIKKAVPISKISALNNMPLTMFYCLSFMKNSIYYIEELKTVVIADFEGNTLHLNDIFSETPIDLEEVVKAMVSETINKVVLGFTPLNDTSYLTSVLQGGDTLFVLRDKGDLFKGSQWRFPLLSHG